MGSSRAPGRMTLNPQRRLLWGFASFAAMAAFTSTALRTGLGLKPKLQQHHHRHERHASQEQTALMSLHPGGAVMPPNSNGRPIRPPTTTTAIM